MQRPSNRPPGGVRAAASSTSTASVHGSGEGSVTAWRGPQQKRQSATRCTSQLKHSGTALRHRSGRAEHGAADDGAEDNRSLLQHGTNRVGRMMLRTTAVYCNMGRTVSAARGTAGSRNMKRALLALSQARLQLSTDGVGSGTATTPKDRQKERRVQRGRRSSRAT